MALTYHGVTASPVNGAGTTTTATPSLPTDWQAGYLAFALFARVSGVDPSDPSSAPTGWTLLGKQDNGISGSWLYFRVLESGDSAPSATWGVGTRTSGHVFTFSGYDVDGTTPTAYAGTNTATVSSTCPVAALSLATAAPMVIISTVYSNSSTTYSPYAPANPGTFTEHYDAFGNSSYASVSVQSYATASATLDAGNITLSAARTSKTSHSVALMPATATGRPEMTTMSKMWG